MDASEAIGILRGDVSPSSVLHRGIAENMGAEALAAFGWLLSKEIQEAGVTFSESYGWRCHVWGIIGHGDTPLQAVLDAMEKEGKK